MCKSFTSLCVLFCDEIVNRNGIRNSSLDLALASCRRITQDSCRLRRNTAETEMISYTDISSTDDRHAADSRPLGSDRYVDRVITASIDRHSMECLRKVGFYSPTIDRLSTDMSTECRSTGRSRVNHTRSICRSSVDRWCRLLVDRWCRSLVVPYCGILFLRILGRLDQLGSLRRKSTAHLKHSIPTRQLCKSVFIVILTFTNDCN